MEHQYLFITWIISLFIWSMNFRAKKRWMGSVFYRGFKTYMMKWKVYRGLYFVEASRHTWWSGKDEGAKNRLTRSVFYRGFKTYMMKWKGRGFDFLIDKLISVLESQTEEYKKTRVLLFFTKYLCKNLLRAKSLIFRITLDVLQAILLSFLHLSSSSLMKDFLDHP